MLELGEAFLWWRWTHKQPITVGAETLVGKTAIVAEPGWVRVDGELWRAHGADDARRGDEVRVERVEGLTLLVRR